MRVTITGLESIDSEDDQQCLGRDFLLAMYYHGIMVDGVKVEFSDGD